MILSQFEEAVRHRRGSDCDIAEAWHHGGEIVSAVKAVLEFGEVAGYMLVADGAVSAGDGALDVAEGGVDPLEGRVQGGLATRSSDDRLVDAAGVADPSEAVQAVTDNGAGGMEIALRQGRDFGTAEALHAAELQADWLALWCGFDRRHDRRLARRTAAPLAAVALPTEIGVVDLDPSRQALCGVPLHHRLHELVLDLPGGDLGDAKPAAQLNAGNAALALSEVVHGAKPSAQRHLGRRENRSGDHGCLPSTGGTLVKRPGLDEAVMLPCANRADKAGWPAPAHHHLPALILCPVKNSKLGLAEPLLKLNLLDKSLVIRQLKTAHKMRLEPVRVPNPPHTRLAEADGLGHRPGAPLGCRWGLLVQGFVHHLRNHFGCQRRLAPGTAGVALEPGDPLRHVALLPAPHRRLALAHLASDRHRPNRGRRQQYDARSPDQFLRRITVRQPILQLRPILRRQPDAYLCVHTPIIAQPYPKGIFC